MFYLPWTLHSRRHATNATLNMLTLTRTNRHRMVLIRHISRYLSACALSLKTSSRYRSISSSWTFRTRYVRRRETLTSFEWRHEHAVQFSRHIRIFLSETVFLSFRVTYSRLKVYSNAMRCVHYDAFSLFFNETVFEVWSFWRFSRLF